MQYIFAWLGELSIEGITLVYNKSVSKQAYLLVMLEI